MDFDFRPIFTCDVGVEGIVLASFRIGGAFKIEHYDRDGNLKGVGTADLEIADAFGFAKNSWTLGALDDLLNVYLGSATRTTTWYMAPIDNSGYSAVANNDTMSSHNGWTEFTGYSGSTRPTWTPGSSSSQTVTNGTSVDFAINATGNVKGYFLTSVNTKSGTTGILCCTAVENSPRAVSSGDTLKVTYNCQAQVIS